MGVHVVMRTEQERVTEEVEGNGAWETSVVNVAEKRV